MCGYSVTWSSPSRVCWPWSAQSQAPGSAGGGGLGEQQDHLNDARSQKRVKGNYCDRHYIWSHKHQSGCVSVFSRCWHGTWSVLRKHQISLTQLWGTCLSRFYPDISREYISPPLILVAGGSTSYFVKTQNAPLAPKRNHLPGSLASTPLVSNGMLIFRAFQWIYTYRTTCFWGA